MEELLGLITDYQQPELAGLVVDLHSILANSTVFENMKGGGISDFFVKNYLIHC